MSQSTHGQQWLVQDADAGATVAALVKQRLSISWNEAKRHVTTGKVFVDGKQVTAIDHRLEPGQAVELRMSAPRPRTGQSEVRIVYDDAHVVVIEKPSGVSSVPYEEREGGTAMDLLRDAWRRKYPDATRVPLHVVHRIDKATSGLLMFAKSKRAELGLAAQLRAHSLEREYICAVHGVAQSGRIESRLVRDRGDGLRGSTRFPNQGKRAVTHVRMVEEAAGASLCRIRLETGKTHQIRIHLAEAGHPLIGETVYIRDFVTRGGNLLASPRLLLHAATLGFTHPLSGKTVSLESPLPEDFASVWRRLSGPRQ